MTIGTGIGARRGVAAVASAFVIALALCGTAQAQRHSSRPVPLDEKLDRLLERPPTVISRDPLGRRQGYLRRELEDPAARAGLPPQPKLDAPPDQSAPPALAPTLPPELSRMDRNGDGVISRDEYLGTRNRLPPGSIVNPTDAARQRQYLERMGSRFRGADSNRDGLVTPQELESYGNPRF